MQVGQQVQWLLRGVEAVYSPEELAQRLGDSAASGKPLRVKLGMDPTAPDIHVGHSVVLRKLRQFQDLGHKAVLIIGDYTARIGDPSGQNTTRPMLSPEQIRANADTYFQQAGKILDTRPERCEIRYNSEWLGQLTFADILRLTGQITVARMLERDTFALRYKAQTPIYLHEFLYPLMQAYDSVCVQADVELGGSDQTYNTLCGRDIQAAYGQKGQVVMILPILVGLDGAAKMSKSKGNYIGVEDAPNEMFGKVMSIPDTLMENYYALLTDLPPAQIAERIDPARTHPRQAKAALAAALVAQYHGGDAAEAAAAEFDRVFAARGTPTEMPDVPVPGGEMSLVDLLVKHAGFAASNGEARRLIQQGAVTLDGRRVDRIDAVVTPADGAVLKVGKRRFGKIVIEGPRP